MAGEARLGNLNPNPKYTWSWGLRLACLLDMLTDPLCPKGQCSTAARQDRQAKHTAPSLGADYFATLGQIMATGMSEGQTALSLGHEETAWRARHSHLLLSLFHSKVGVAVTRPGKVTPEKVSLHCPPHPLGGVAPCQARAHTERCCRAEFLATFSPLLLPLKHSQRPIFRLHIRGIRNEDDAQLIQCEKHQEVPYKTHTHNDSPTFSACHEVWSLSLRRSTAWWQSMSVGSVIKHVWGQFPQLGEENICFILFVWRSKEKMHMKCSIQCPQ